MFPLSGELERAPDSFGEDAPAFLFFLELPAAGRGDRVEARLAAGVGGAPFGAQPSVGCHALQGGVERTLLDPQRGIGHLVNPLGDRITVLRAAARERAEDQEVEGSLQAVVGMLGIGSYI